MAQYKLRVGKWRVYYDVIETEGLVKVKAFGLKDRDRILIGGKEIKL